MLFKSKPTSQQSILIQAVKSAARTSYGKLIHINNLELKDSFETLYKNFSLNIPLLQDGNVSATLDRILQQKTTDITAELKRSNLLIAGEPELLAPTPLTHWPIGKKQHKNLLTGLNSALLKTFNQTKVTGGVLYIPPLKQAFASPDLCTQILNQIAASHPKLFVDTTDVVNAAGRSQFQQLHAYLTLAEQLGDKLQAIVAEPKTIADIALLYLQQKQGQSTLANCCPNLKLVVHYGQSMLPYRRELGLLWKQFTQLNTFEIYCRAPGILAVQADINLRDRLNPNAQSDCFYEFIPLEYMRPDGQLQRQYVRKDATQVEVGKEYILVVSTTAGLLAVQTDSIVKILSKGPLTWQRRRHFSVLNHFGENLNLNECDQLIAELNDALIDQGVLIREMIVADDVNNRCQRWLLELNQQPSSVKPAVLQSIANKIHTELSLRLPAYRKAHIDYVGIQPPQFHFAGRGTLLNLPERMPYTAFDTSTNAQLIYHAVKHSTGHITVQASAQLV
jgi:hypothetical protein